MKKVIPTLLLLVMGVGMALHHAKAKQAPAHSPTSYQAQHRYLSHEATRYYQKVPLPASRSVSEGILTTILQQVPHLDHPSVTLQLMWEKPSKGGFHYTYQQYVNGIPVYGAFVKVNLDDAGNIRSLIDGSYDINSWELIAIENEAKTLHPNQASEYLLAFNRSAKLIIQPTLLVDQRNGQVQVTNLVAIDDRQGDQYRQAFINTKGKALLELDLLRYHAPADTMVTATVFNPDPLTTAGQIYATPYIDSRDSDIVELNDERITVNMPADFDGGVFKLQNTYAIICEHSSPNIQAVTSSTPSFDLLRSESGFEDVNAFYHINAFQQWLAHLGYDQLMDFQIQVDTHAFNDDDQSGFLSSNPQKLLFGEGGVDDAEDADVIIHEYGHAVSYNANGNPNSQFERKALDEAIGDYFAASYSREKSEVRWEDVFTWDGHNEFWSGRNAASTKHYPDDLGPGSYHLNGEIFSSVLMEINQELGRETTDEIVVESLFSWFESMKMTDAAHFLIDADSTLNNGANFCVLQSYLHKRGLLVGNFSYNGSTYILDASDNVALCPGGNTILSASTSGFPGVTFTWTPSNSINIQNDSTVIVFPDSTTIYTVRATDPFGCFLEKNIRVDVGGSETSPNDTICEGDTIWLTTSGGNSYAWSPATFLDDPFSQSPVAIPPVSTMFRVEILVNPQCIHHDSVYVQVNLCHAGVSLRNKDGFADGSGNLYILLPRELEEAEVVFIDMWGRMLYHGVHYSSDQIVIPPDNLSAGVYIVRVISRFDTNDEKVVKIR